MSSNSFPHLQKSAPQVPRAIGGLVARTKRAKSGVSPVCPKCHNFLPRARESSARAERCQVTPELYFSFLFLVVAVRADRANTITVGVSSRHDCPLSLMPVAALVAEIKNAANGQLAHSDSKSTEICRELAADPVAVKSKHCQQNATDAGVTLWAQSETERHSGQPDLRRPAISEAHPGHGSFQGGRGARWRRRPISGQQNSLKIRLTRLTDCTPQLTRQCPVPFPFSWPRS